MAWWASVGHVCVPLDSEDEAITIETQGPFGDM